MCSYIPACALNLYEHYNYYLCAVDDVSTQTSCAISPNLTTLKIRDNLQRDVELHCQCMDSNGIMITGTRWFRNENLVGVQDHLDPYYIAGVPNRLIIDGPFSSSYDGTYTCSPNSTFPAGGPLGDTITLTAQGEYACIILNTFS